MNTILSVVPAQVSTPPIPATEGDPTPAGLQQAEGLISEAMQGDWNALAELARLYVLPAVVFLLILLVAYFLGRFLARTARVPVAHRIDPTLGTFTGKIVFWSVMIGALLGALQYVGIGVAGFAAAIAAAGFAIGLAFQGSLSNFAAGIMLLVFRPFKVGDAVNAAGITAKVYDIDLFYTVLDTFDNRRIIVPNSEITKGSIENITFHPVRRAEVAVGVAYASNLDAVRDALNAAAEAVPGVQRGQGQGHQVLVMDFGNSSINWVVRAWFTKEDFWTNREKLIHAIKAELDRAAIEIPFPQMDVHIRDKSAE